MHGPNDPPLLTLTSVVSGPNHGHVLDRDTAALAGPGLARVATAGRELRPA